MIKRMCRLGLATRQNERDSLEKNEDVEGYEAANRNPYGIYVFCMISFLVSAVSYAATPWKIFHIYLESCDGQHDRESQQRHNFSQKLFFSVSYISTQGTKKTP